MEGFRFDPCPEDQSDCPLYPNCFADKDHLFGPANAYRTSLEREFRHLPDNIVVRCRNKHNERHATEAWPPKPPREEMIRAIGGLASEQG